MHLNVERSVAISRGDRGRFTGGIIWEVEGRGSGSKGVAYHTDSPTQVEDFDLGW